MMQVRRYLQIGEMHARVREGLNSGCCRHTQRCDAPGSGHSQSSDSRSKSVSEARMIGTW